MFACLTNPTRSSRNAHVLGFGGAPFYFFIINPNFLIFSCSKRRFNAQQAEEWWKENKDKVFKKYSPARTRASSSAPPAEENNEEPPPAT